MRDAARGAGRERLLIEPNYHGYRIVVTTVTLAVAPDTGLSQRQQWPEPRLTASSAAVPRLTR